MASGRTTKAKVGVALIAAVALYGGQSVAVEPAATDTTAVTGETRKPDRMLGTAQLRRLLARQPLPSTERIPITATSHPWNGAAWQNKPIDLRDHGYVEREYYLSGHANVYDWNAGTDHDTTVLRSGDYTTRLDVRRPRNMKKWSGEVVVEIINMSAGYDWTAIWSAIWEKALADGDVYVGITAKPNVLPGLLRFDEARYGRLSFANPLPPDEQECGRLPDDPDYDPNLSRLYENGLVWDMLTQTGRLLKSRSGDNPLGRPATRVMLSGESQSANYLLTYHRYFTPAAVLRNGDPVFDSYLAEAGVGIAGAPINQCAPTANPLPDDDFQATTFPRRSVPWLGINSQWDYPGVRGWTAPADANTFSTKRRFWELAGSHHGWEWQYLYGDANAEDLLKAGFWDPATYAWSCTPNNPEVPLYMSEKAAYHQLKRWARGGKAPSRAPRILTGPSDTIDTTMYDGLGNAMGGIRYPMLEAPVARYGAGQYALSGDCTEQIVPFDDETLRRLYPTRQSYLDRYRDATTDLLHDGFILREDVRKLMRIARSNTSVRAAGS